MKIRIASSIAIAATIALGATGCSLIAPQGTTVPYAPSDGINVDVEGVSVRNLMLIADESGKNFNVVFSTVNLTSQDQELIITFTGEGTQQARAEFVVPTGSTRFGNPDGPEVPVLVTIPKLEPGATVDAYLRTSGSEEKQRFVPVLDGEHEEYRAYVLPADFAEKASAEAKKVADEDAESAEPKVNDDQPVG
ncbi:DNA modification methylase [Leucobacter insecticola]|uniref:DNA modification methylase n=1 Tax=Leucobacter insecticola TaxID=2714934 RepID=A0A6G8FG69_9MICO|nr:DNA modification methylase [Leucobacter insecticola]QIM15243.1 DNA modification methylase [Leucobacter insecticola]